MSLFAAAIKRSTLSFSKITTKIFTGRAMHIQSIPMWEGSGNNYAYLISCDQTKHAAIIDPANPNEYADVLSEQIDHGDLKLKYIINTHHHRDHAGGNEDMASLEPSAPDCFKRKYDVPIIGGKDCAKVTDTPNHKNTFNLGTIKFTALHTPCHTQDSICYFVEDGQDRVVFTGDTLFIGGCGRFFEGNPEQMHKALNETLAALPDDTKVYPGHEYTKGNVKFAKKVLNNDAIQRLDAYSQANRQTQGKFTIGDEKQHNVFMRLDDPDIQKATGKKEPIDVMGALRSMKDAS
ncbi:hydroxyacylglutathione hydrolase [Plenodomus tracheiphilus IPT5]|uniref:hydroxyacylglutathione hydrolase n=1 Tax=Plenodomus tracheiphilus IPT5 TaxID=1408161 RepID=A0A6A7B9M0_9PLEO|nr:hydroxyacylglutathione hydrolase [Plenodomus tracheiphilus IPT5]